MSSPPVSPGTLHAVIDAIHKHTGKTARAGDHLVNDLGMDSLEIVSLALSLETEFELREIKYQQRDIQTVADLAAAVQRTMVNEGKPGAA